MPIVAANPGMLRVSCNQWVIRKGEAAQRSQRWGRGKALAQDNTKRGAMAFQKQPKSIKIVLEESALRKYAIL